MGLSRSKLRWTLKSAWKPYSTEGYENFDIEYGYWSKRKISVSVWIWNWHSFDGTYEGNEDLISFREDHFALYRKSSSSQRLLADSFTCIIDLLAFKFWYGRWQQCWRELLVASGILRGTIFKAALDQIQQSWFLFLHIDLHWSESPWSLLRKVDFTMKNMKKNGKEI